MSKKFRMVRATLLSEIFKMQAPPPLRKRTGINHSSQYSIMSPWHTIESLVCHIVTSHDNMRRPSEGSHNISWSNRWQTWDTESLSLMTRDSEWHYDNRQAQSRAQHAEWSQSQCAPIPGITTTLGMIQWPSWLMIRWFIPNGSATVRYSSYGP